MKAFDFDSCLTQRYASFSRSFTKVQRDADVVRCIRIQEQDTTEWIEREIARRARQRPPKPTAKAKTIGRKLIDMVGA